MPSENGSVLIHDHLERISILDMQNVTCEHSFALLLVVHDVMLYFAEEEWRMRMNDGAIFSLHVLMLCTGGPSSIKRAPPNLTM